MLIGAANYILLIRKGNRRAPATQEEVDNLKQHYNFLAKLPVIISDHRLEIDIIAPKLDFVLKQDAYDNPRPLDPDPGAVRVPARRRSAPSTRPPSRPHRRRHPVPPPHDQADAGAELAKAVVDHPKNAGLFDPALPGLHPAQRVDRHRRRSIMSALLALRTQREISRDTILEYLGLDEATEAQRLELEETSSTTTSSRRQIPFASPGAGGAPAGRPAGPAVIRTGMTSHNPQRHSGGSRPVRRGGGRPSVAAESTQSPQVTAKPKTRNGNPSTKEN
jgi:hypothetical protein